MSAAITCAPSSRVTLHKKDALPPTLKVRLLQPRSTGHAWAVYQHGGHTLPVASSSCFLRPYVLSCYSRPTRHGSVKLSPPFLACASHAQGLGFPLLENANEYVLQGFSFQDYLREVEVRARAGSHLPAAAQHAEVWTPMCEELL